MPLYEYHCEPCDHRFETLIRSPADLARCPLCSSVDVAKLLSIPATAKTGRVSENDLPLCGETGVPAFGCGRPQCSAGVCRGLD
jgi:putative FmdB family regulatory protein